MMTFARTDACPECGHQRRVHLALRRDDNLVGCLEYQCTCNRQPNFPPPAPPVVLENREAIERAVYGENWDEWDARRKAEFQAYRERYREQFAEKRQERRGAMPVELLTLTAIVAIAALVSWVVRDKSQ